MVVLSWLERHVPPPRLARLRRWARWSGWGALACIALTIAAVATDQPARIGGLVVIPAMVLAGLWMAIEWGLAVVLVGRVRTEGFASLARQLITGKETVLQGRLVRLLGLMWLLIGLAFVTLGIVSTGSLVLELNGPSGVHAAQGKAHTWNGLAMQLPLDAQVDLEQPDRFELQIESDLGEPRRLTLSPWAGPTGNWEGQAALLPEGPDDWRTRMWVGWRLGAPTGQDHAIEACGRLMGNGLDLAFCCSPAEAPAEREPWCLPWLASIHLAGS